MQEIIIGQNDGGQRVDRFLVKAFPALPQALLYKYIRLKRVKVNGKRTELSYRLAKGDILQLYINDELLAIPAEDEAWRRASTEVSIVYEDAHILVADKPAGLLCHEDESERVNTLICRIKAYLCERGAWNPEDAHSFAPALCHRIDRNTSGLVLAAKSAEGLRVMNGLIRDRQVDKRYLCLVHGRPRPPNATLTGYIRRDKRAKQVTVLDKPGPGALTAITEYQVLDSRRLPTGEWVSLVECILHTGRTHQIRAQMAHAGHPLAGDTKYGTASLNDALPFRHQALHAYSLTLGEHGDWGELAYLRGKGFRAGQSGFMPWLENLSKK